MIGAAIYTGGCLIQDQYLIAAQYCSGEAEQLSLADTKVGASFGNGRIEAKQIDIAGIGTFRNIIDEGNLNDSGNCASVTQARPG